MVSAGAFRRDLLYRIRVAHLQIPPLRERREDIPLLVQHFVRKLEHPLRFSDEAMKAVQDYDWPGNIRELQSLIEQAVLLTDEVVSLEDLPAAFQHQKKAIKTSGERRRQPGDKLYDQLVEGTFDFWADIHAMFLKRDLTRHDLRHLVRRGLTTTCGNYHALLTLFRIPDEDYKRLLNFLATHDCMPDFREFRSGTASDEDRTRGRRTNWRTSPQE
jgi:DNA-binding NtrC family response regulator